MPAVAAAGEQELVHLLGSFQEIAAYRHRSPVQEIATFEAFLAVGIGLNTI